MNLVVFGVVAQALTIGASGTNSGTVAADTYLTVGDAVNSTLAPPGTTVLTKNGAGTLTFAFPTYSFPCNLIQSAALSLAGASLPSGITLAMLVGATISSPDGYFASGVTVLGVGPDNASLLLSAAPTSVPSTTTPVAIEFALTSKSLTAGTDANSTFNGATTVLGGTVTVQVERSFDGGYKWVAANIGGGGTPATFAALANALSLSFGDPEAGSLYRLNCLSFAAAIATTSLNYRWSATGQAGIVASTPAIM
jgi:hypothetical protein